MMTEARWRRAEGRARGPVLLALLVGTLLACAADRDAADQLSAGDFPAPCPCTEELALVNGKVLTMDKAQSEASADINAEEVDAFRTVAQWWDKWYRKAGHKRLARTPLEYRDVR